MIRALFSRFALLTLLPMAGLAGCTHKAGVVPVQPITEWEATQLGAQSMNQIESWEPNIVYDTRREGEYWKIYGFKTRGKDLRGNPVYEPGLYRVIKLSQYGRVVDFWRSDNNL